MKIRGKDCGLIICNGGSFIRLPNCRETIRCERERILVPANVRERSEQVYILGDEKITGCFVTRLDKNNVRYLFGFLEGNEVFDIYTERVVVRKVYKNVEVKEFELRAENEGPIKFYLGIEGTKDSSWKILDMNLKIGSTSIIEDRTFIFDGHGVIADGVKIPLIYRFVFKGFVGDTKRFKMVLYFPVTEEFYPTMNEIKVLEIPLNQKEFCVLRFYNLMPTNDLTDVNCDSVIIAEQSYIVESYEAKLRF